MLLHRPIVACAALLRTQCQQTRDQQQQPPRICCVGIACVDIVSSVAAYPAEDSDARALTQELHRGGNASNTLTVLSQLGTEGYFCGCLGGDMWADFLVQDFHDCSVNTEYGLRREAAATPTSCITLSQASGSRTIVHINKLPEMRADEFRHVTLIHIYAHHT